MLSHLRAIPSFTLLLLARLISSLFYRCETRMVESGEQPIDWKSIRVIAVLNHTSLFEWLYVSAVPLSFLYRAARQAVIPVADKTLARPVVGSLFRLLTSEVISVTRQPDETWQAVIDRVGTQRMIVLFPEGRMMRANGLDKDGNPMTVLGGIADIVGPMESGKMLIGYSAGLHHVQVPGQKWPKLFKTIRIGLEQVDIADYRRSLGEEPGSQEFKLAMKQDLQRRRDRECPKGGSANAG